MLKKLIAICLFAFILSILCITCFAASNEPIQSLAAQTNDILQPNTPLNPDFVKTANHLSNKCVTLDFQNIPVRSVIQLIADFTGLNIIVSSSVSGNITLRLHNVPWDQALTIILQTQGLAKQQIGNALLIAPIAEITAHETATFQAQQQLANLAPLQAELLPINYGKASDIVILLQNKAHSLLSSRGTASADKRTNTIWVQDVPDKLMQIRDFVQRLDVPVKQISIQARIVTIDTKYEQELGIRFGVTRANNNMSGTFAGANNLADNISPAAVSNPLNRLNVDLPAMNVGSEGGASSLGLALTKIGGGNLLDLELSALESEGGGEIISNPRLITNNEQAAVILSGEEIPYQQSTESGGTSVTFKKAVLSLSVTPQINPNGKISLTLKLNQDRPSNTLVHGVPAIETRQIQTNVLVDDGETIVLGGIYEQTQRNQVERVPFLGQLPLVGQLFRHTLIHKDRKELLIFVTPSVMG